LIQSTFNTIIARLQNVENDDINLANSLNKLLSTRQEESNSINSSIELRSACEAIEKLNKDMQMCKQAIQMILNQFNCSTNQ
jgi:hypothetical protein